MALFYLLICCASCFLAFGFEYIVNYDRLELVYYDRSLVSDSHFLFRKYNRTNHVLNISFDLKEDLDGNQMKFTSSVYQWSNNEYKPLNYKVSFNVCEYWKKNIYGTRDHFGKYGNLEACDIKKGNYYLNNYMPDESIFPKYVPLGSYLIQIDVVRNSGGRLLVFGWYVTAEIKLKRQSQNSRRNRPQ